MNTSTKIASKVRAAAVLASIFVTLSTVSLIAEYAYPVSAPVQLASVAVNA
jgi:hypothetical protein